MKVGRRGQGHASQVVSSDLQGRFPPQPLASAVISLTRTVSRGPAPWACKMSSSWKVSWLGQKRSPVRAEEGGVGAG